MSEKTLTVLGSTGSIGRNTLDVVQRFPGRFRIHALAANNNVEMLADQIDVHHPAVAVVFDPEAASRLREILPGNGATAVLTGMEGLVEAVSAPEVDQVISGMVGSVGLRPTYAAIECGKQVAIANKETLVLAGQLMIEAAAESGARLLPMDSEHNAIFQCLNGNGSRGLERIVLTASGGPFRDLPFERFGEITREQALAHPNWKMGPKISIDSATMMNKGLEVIEARWLFGLQADRIQVLIHRQSIVHSMVEFVDGSVIAQLGLPDMRTPIAHCLAYPDRLPLDLPRLNLAEVGKLEFEEVPPDKFSCLFLALEVLELGGGAPAALNGANEEIVAVFLDDGLLFSAIPTVLGQVVKKLKGILRQPEPPSGLRDVGSVEEALDADRWGRDAALAIIDNAAYSHRSANIA